MVKRAKAGAAPQKARHPETAVLDEEQRAEFDRLPAQTKGTVVGMLEIWQRVASGFAGIKRDLPVDDLTRLLKSIDNCRHVLSTAKAPKLLAMCDEMSSAAHAIAREQDTAAGAVPIKTVVLQLTILSNGSLSVCMLPKGARLSAGTWISEEKRYPGDLTPEHAERFAEEFAHRLGSEFWPLMAGRLGGATVEQKFDWEKGARWKRLLVEYEHIHPAYRSAGGIFRTLRNRRAARLKIKEKLPGVDLNLIDRLSRRPPALSEHEWTAADLAREHAARSCGCPADEYGPEGLRKLFKRFRDKE